MALDDKPVLDQELARQHLRMLVKLLVAIGNNLPRLAWPNQDVRAAERTHVVAAGFVIVRQWEIGVALEVPRIYAEESVAGWERLRLGIWLWEWFPVILVARGVRTAAAAVSSGSGAVSSDAVVVSDG